MLMSEFAAKLKAKYPSYANIPDKQLVDSVLIKHPQYGQQFDPAPVAICKAFLKLP